MKRIVAAVLSFALLCGCAPAAEEQAPDRSRSAEELVLAALEGSGEDAAALERTDQRLDGEALAAYIAGCYGIEADAWEDCAICRAGGAEAAELAVLRLAEGADEEAVRAGLEGYLEDREGDFTGYAPAQADIVSRSLAAVQSGYAGLFICADAQAARAAFLDLLGVEAPDDGPSPTVTAAPSPSPAPEPPPGPSDPGPPDPAPPDPSTPAQPDVSVPPDPDPDASDIPTPTPTPPGNEPEETPEIPPEGPSPEPSVEPSPEPPAEPTRPAAVTFPGRVDFIQPGIDDMTIYDTKPILAAWAAGDPSALSEGDRAVYDKCEQVLDRVLKEGMSGYEKELAVYQWLIGSAVYDRDHYDALVEMDPASYTPYGPLIAGKGVCLGFATSFQLLMDLCGVECITVVGAAFSSREDHAWNMVRLEGEWYCVDATWDLNSSPFRLRYFNVTSDRMAETDHQWDYDHVPEATATDGGRPR